MRVPRWLVAVASVMIIGLLGFTVWPTLWRVERWHEELVRLNRFTGTAEVLTAHGWSPMERNPFADLVEEERRRQRKFIDSADSLSSRARPRSP